MNDSVIQDIPEVYETLGRKSEEIGFDMPSDLYAGSFLKTLICSKPNGHFLELGTGIGLSLSWMLDGMDFNSKITTIDNDPELIKIAEEHFANDKRLEIICADASEWIQNYQGDKFDLIFADAWPGKYSQIDEVLELLKVGGLYVIDDMSVQLNWPKGHENNVNGLIAYLEQREDFSFTKMNWSTGIIIAVKNI